MKFLLTKTRALIVVLAVLIWSCALVLDASTVAARLLNVEKPSNRLVEDAVRHRMQGQSSSKATKKSTTKEKPILKRADNVAGVYLTAPSAGNDKFLTKTFDTLIASGGNAVVLDVKGSNVYFHSAAPIANDVQLVRPSFDLPEILAAAKARGIYTIGRFIAIKDTSFTSRKPGTSVRHPKTNAVISDWSDPANEDVIAYNTELMCELAAAGIDEINLDYIRFSTSEFGALRAYTGKEKADRLEKFILASRDAIDRCGPDTKLGISTYAILGWNFPVNFETLGQDIPRFAKIVDIISPMAYPATFAAGHYYNPAKNPGSRSYYLVYRTMTGYAELVGPENLHKLRPWIQGYSITSKDMVDQISAVYDAGACGFSVWSASNSYAPTYAGMTAAAAKRPERCR